MEENARKLVCHGTSVTSSVGVMVVFEKLRIKYRVWQNILQEEKRFRKQIILSCYRTVMTLFINIKCNIKSDFEMHFFQKQTFRVL